MNLESPTTSSLQINSSSSNNNNNNMVALASRIQDRANQFFAEQEKLASFKAELEETKSLEEKESNINRFIRRNLLETTRSRHGVELELHDFTDRKSGYVQSLEQLREETEKIQKETQVVEAKLKKEIKHVYAPHESQLDVYVRAIEIEKERRESQVNKKRERRREVEEGINALKLEQESLRQVSRDLKVQRANLESQQLDGDIEISNLRNQVQHAISERISLRNSLKTCQEELGHDDDSE